MTDANGVPNLKDELNRKTFDAIEWLFDSVRLGKMSQQQFSTGVDAVFMAVNGLIGDEILEIVQAADEVAGRKPAVKRRAFVKQGTTVVVAWEIGASEWRYTAVGAIARKTKTLDAAAPLAACLSMTALCDKLLLEGWEEL